jgi:hypothetical protein
MIPVTSAAVLFYNGGVGLQAIYDKNLAAGRRLDYNRGMPKNPPWYFNGLAFDCLGCGRCCRGEPGFVWISERRGREIAVSLSIVEQSFIGEFTHVENGRRALNESANGDCVFLEDGRRCRIYAVRPAQCRAWPFWPASMKSASAWIRAAKKCPGMNGGAHHTFEEILEKLREFKFGDA